MLISASHIAQSEHSYPTLNYPSSSKGKEAKRNLAETQQSVRLHQGLHISHITSRSQFIKLQFQFIRQIASARRQWKELAVFEWRCSLVQLSTTLGGSFTQQILMLNVKQGSCECHFSVLGLIQPEIKLVEKKTYTTNEPVYWFSKCFLCVLLFITKLNFDHYHTWNQILFAWNSASHCPMHSTSPSHYKRIINEAQMTKIVIFFNYFVSTTHVSKVAKHLTLKNSLTLIFLHR